MLATNYRWLVKKKKRHVIYEPLSSQIRSSGGGESGNAFFFFFWTVREEQTSRCQRHVGGWGGYGARRSVRNKFQPRLTRVLKMSRCVGFGFSFARQRICEAVFSLRRPRNTAALHFRSKLEDWDMQCDLFWIGSTDQLISTVPHPTARRQPRNIWADLWKHVCLREGSRERGLFSGQAWLSVLGGLN